MRTSTQTIPATRRNRMTAAAGAVAAVLLLVTEPLDAGQRAAGPVAEHAGHVVVDHRRLHERRDGFVETLTMFFACSARFFYALSRRS